MPRNAALALEGCNILGEGPSRFDIGPVVNDGDVPRATELGDMPRLNPLFRSLSPASAQMERMSLESMDVPGTLWEWRCRFSCWICCCVPGRVMDAATPFIGFVEEVRDIRRLCSSGVRRSLRDEGTKSSMSSSSIASAKALKECASVDIRERTGKDPTANGVCPAPKFEVASLRTPNASGLRCENVVCVPGALNVDCGMDVCTEAAESSASTVGDVPGENPLIRIGLPPGEERGGDPTGPKSTDVETD